MKRIKTFICFISRLYGAHILKTIISLQMRRLNVSMHITGKILEEDLNCLNLIPSSNVRTGEKTSSMRLSMMDARIFINAHMHMDRKKSTILQHIKQSPVNLELIALKFIVLIITLNLKDENSFQKDFYINQNLLVEINKKTCILSNSCQTIRSYSQVSDITFINLL